MGGRGQRLQVAPQQQSPAPFPEVFGSQQQQQGFGQQQSRFQNFPRQQQAFQPPQQQFQPQQQQQFQQQPFQQQQQFSPQQQQFDPRQQQQFSPRQQQFAQQQPQQQFSGAEQTGSIVKAELPQAPGAGSLFDSIVKKINNGHREKARRKQGNSGRGRNPSPAATGSSDPFRAPVNRPNRPAAPAPNRPAAALQPSDNRAPVPDLFSTRPRSQQLRPNNPRQQTSRARPGQSETVRRPAGGQVATGNRRPAPALGLALFGRGEVAPALGITHAPLPTLMEPPLALQMQEWRRRGGKKRRRVRGKRQRWRRD